MKAKMILLVATLSISGAAISGVAVAAEQPARRESYADKYGPISEHNIFAKDRPIKKVPTTRPTSAQHDPEESLVLRGVALDNDGSIRAYVEDLDNSKTLKLSLGDSVARGKITGMDIDAVEYERNGEPIWIEAGADFTGKQVVAVTSDSTNAPTTGPAEVINPNDPNLTMEQKLKLRRMQERSK